HTLSATHTLSTITTHTTHGAPVAHYGCRQHPAHRPARHMLNHPPAHASDPDHPYADRLGATAELGQVHQWRDTLAGPSGPAKATGVKIGFSRGSILNR